MTDASTDSGPRSIEAVGEGFYCLGCGYALRGLTVARCPECGKGFDPAKPKTMRIRGKISEFDKLFGKRVGWPLHIAVGLTVLASLNAVSVPDRYTHPE